MDACSWIGERLSSYLDGELEASQRREVRDHLMRCSRCESTRQDLERHVERIRAIAEPRLDPPEALWGRVRTTFLERAASRRRLVRKGYLVGAAAGILLGLGWLWRVSRVSPLHEGQVVQTAVGETARLLLAGGSEVRLGEETRIAVVARTGGLFSFRLEWGTALCTTSGQERFEVRAPGARVRDIGTTFEVSVIRSGKRLKGFSPDNSRKQDLLVRELL